MDQKQDKIGSTRRGRGVGALSPPAQGFDNRSRGDNEASVVFALGASVECRCRGGSSDAGAWCILLFACVDGGVVVFLVLVMGGGGGCGSGGGV